jgi:hypothetical protein
MSKPLGQIGYEAYAVSTGGKTFDGRDMPKWDELPSRVQVAWFCAASAIRDEFVQATSPLAGEGEVSK